MPTVAEMFKLGDFNKHSSIKGTPIERLVSSIEVAETVLFLFSDAASYIIGQPISVDGGLSII